MSRLLAAGPALCGWHAPFLAASQPATVAVDAQGEALPGRLPQALPRVTDVSFQDLDLDPEEISGTVTWVPPADTTELSGYTAYLTDSLGTVAVHAQLGDVPVGTNSIEVPIHTSLITGFGNRTHIFVFTKSQLGVSPEGVGTVVCDARTADSVFLVNAEPTTMPWGVTDLSFHSRPDCTGPALPWAVSGSTGHDGANSH